MNIFKLSFALIIAGLAFASCSKENNCKSGSGGTITRTLSLASFSSIDFQEAGEVIITQGATQQVVATGDANVVNDINLDVNNGQWEVDFDRECYRNYELTIFVTLPTLNGVFLSGSGSITVNDFFNQQSNFDLEISGSGTTFLSAFEGPESIAAEISGSGNIILSAEIPGLKDLSIGISGSGSFEGYSAVTDDCSVNISGSGNCQVNVNDHLDVKITGSGSVFYKGSPTITTNITGSGEVIDAN